MNQTNERAIQHKRQCSRRIALQALYQWQFTHDTAQELLEQYQNDEYWPKSDPEYISSLVNGCIDQTEDIDQHILSVSEYSIDKIDPIELAALRLAVYEIIHCQQIPEKVIIAEAIRLCKKFGSDEGFRLVNVILDKLIKNIDRSALI